MKQKVYRGEWAYSSDLPNRKERQKAHEEFIHSNFKKMLDEGWEVKNVRKKRERIPIKVKFRIFGEATMDIPVEILKAAGFYK